MSWQKEVDEIGKRKKLAEAMGGPEKLKKQNADGKLNDAHDVKLGMTANSLFAYVADGKNGLQVVQVMSPEGNPNIYGFSPKPTPMCLRTGTRSNPTRISLSTPAEPSVASGPGF